MSTLESSDISAIARMYLAQRNYTNGEGSEESLSLQEAAVQSVAAGAASAESAVSQSLQEAQEIDSQKAETQFSRFRVWVLESPRQYKCQLQQLLFAVFVRLHLQLVSAGHNPCRFYSRHHSVVMLKPSQSLLVGQLASICCVDDLQRSQSLQSHRPAVPLSHSCLQYLQSALSSVTSSLSLIVRCISAEVNVSLDVRQGAGSSSKGSSSLTAEAVNGPDDSSSEEAPSCNHAPSPAAARLQAAINALRSSPPSLPAVCCHRLHVAPISGAALSPDQRVLATCGEWGACVWPLQAEGQSWRGSDTARVPLGCDLSVTAEGEGEREYDRHPLLGHVGPVYSVSLCVDDGSRLVTAGEDTTVRMWDGDTGNNLCVYNGHSYPVWSVACQKAPGAQLFVSGSMDGTGRLWTFERTHPLRVFSGHNLHVDCVTIHQNGNYVCTASGDKSLRVWCCRTAAQVRCIADAHLGLISDIQFSPDGRLVASAGEDCAVRVFDVASGKLLQRFCVHQQCVRCITWAPGSHLLVSGDTAGDIAIHRISTDSACVDGGSNLISASHSVVALHYTSHNYVAAVVASAD